MGLDPYAVRLQQDRDNVQKVNDSIARVINGPINKLRARLGFRGPVLQDDLDKSAREHAPDSWDLLLKVRKGESVEPYAEAPTAEDNRTAKVLNLRKEFAACFPMFTPRPADDDDERH